MHPRRTRSLWSVTAGLAFAVCLASTLVFLQLGGSDRLDTADKTASVVSLLVGVASLVATIITLAIALRPSISDEGTQLQRASDALAREVGRQRQTEQVRLGLSGALEMRVRWESTKRPIAAAPTEILSKDEGPRVTQLRLKGDVADLAELWEQLPAKR